MATRTELLITFEASLGTGFLLPASGKNGSKPVMPDGKSCILESETAVSGGRIIETHVCYFWDADLLNKRNAQFYVVDRGGAGEAALWIRGNDPKPPAPPAMFTQEMTVWLASRIDAVLGTNTLRHIEAITANDAIRRGTATVILETGAGAFVRQSVAVWKDAQAVWQFKAIT